LIELDAGIISKLESYRGTLAYVAVLVRGEGSWPTAHLAAAVNCQTAAMREGLEELSRLHPEAVRRKANTWVVGGGKASDESVQILESEVERRREFLDDLKSYWDFKNPNVPFHMSAADGKHVVAFLKTHKDWDRLMWRAALNNRVKSEVNHSQPLHLFVSRLAQYVASPLDRFNKPMLYGGGASGKAVGIEQANREARAAAVASVPTGR
jgi:hypothetical protein